MASRALASFAATAAGLNLPRDVATALTAAAERLYLDAVREQTEHVRFHMDAELAVRPSDAETTSRASLIQAILNRVRDSSDPLALTIAGALDG